MLIKMEAWEVTDSPNMNRSGGLMGGKYGLFHFVELQLLDWPNPKLFWILKLGLYIYALSNANGSFYLRNIKKKLLVGWIQKATWPTALNWVESIHLNLFSFAHEILSSDVHHGHVYFIQTFSYRIQVLIALICKVLINPLRAGDGNPISSFEN